MGGEYRLSKIDQVDVEVVDATKSKSNAKDYEYSFDFAVSASASASELQPALLESIPSASTSQPHLD